MERETKAVQTPGGHTVVLRAYLTGRESSELKGMVLANLKMSVEGASAVNVGEVSGSFIIEQERKALGFLVVSVDDSLDNPVEKLLDLPSADYDCVVKEVNAVTNPLKPTK